MEAQIEMPDRYCPVDVYFSEATGEFAVLRNVRDKKTGAWAKADDFIRLSGEMMKADGLKIALELMSMSEQQEEGALSELDRMNSKERRRFHKGHKLVWLSRSSNSTITMMPMLKYRIEGGIGQPEHAMEFDISQGAGGFYEALVATFEHSD